jgi:hypothetical protein
MTNEENDSQLDGGCVIASEAWQSRMVYGHGGGACRKKEWKPFCEIRLP